MPIAQSRLEILQIRKVLQCIYDKDYAQIKKLIENGIEHLINYNEPDEGKTCLSLAATENDFETIKFLLDLGAHPDVVDFEGRSAIMISAKYGHTSSFEMLAKAGADLKLCDFTGKNVLYYCISPTERHSQCLDIALRYNVDLNNVTKDGKTVLFSACETADENEDICLNLLKHQADATISQKSTGRTTLMMACASKSSTVVSKCLKLGVDPNIKDRHGKTAVHYAAKSGNFKALVALVSAGAELDVYDDTEDNPIHYAAAGQALCCKYLGQRGCNPKAKNSKGQVPRAIAKHAGAKDCLKELRKVERSFGKLGKNNEPWALTLYDWTVEYGTELGDELKSLDPENSGTVNKKEFVDLLNRLKAPLTEEVENKILPQFDKNKDGTFDYVDFLTGKKYVNKLYLMSAFEAKKKKKKKGGKGRKRKTKIPIEICVMPETQMMRPADGGPPTMFIPKEQYITDLNRFSSSDPPQNEIVDDCLWYICETNKQFVNMNDAAKHGDIDSIKLAIHKGYHVDTRDKFYKTPLMTAAHNGNLHMCMYLVSLGADVNAKDNFHWTSLHHAAHSGMIDVVEFLLNNGATIDAVALNGATPLFRAIETSRFNVVELLIKKGAKIQMENRKGNTPMETAYMWADPRVVDIIKTKFDALPPVKDKKGSQKPKPTAKGRPANTPSKPVEPLPEPNQISSSERAIKRATNTLSYYSKPEVLDDISFTPRHLLVNRPQLDSLRNIRHERRQRFGWEVDFPDEFQSFFHKNLMVRVGASGLED